MMKKYLFNLMALLALVLVVAGCSKENDLTEADYKSNAEKVLGVTIDPNQDWKMIQSVTANITVNDIESGTVFDVKIYENDPLEEEGVYLATGTVKDGGSFVKTFTCPKGLEQLYVGITDDSNYTLYKQGTLENGTLNVTFGTDASSASAQRRSISVNGDVYDAFNFPSSEEITAAFPTSIPDNADEVADLETLYMGKTCQDANGNTITLHDLWHIYAYKIKKDYNLKITKPGTATVGGNYKNIVWDGEANTPQLYNVYVSVDGDLTLNRQGDTHFNLYILKGNVTLPSNYGEQAGLISVSGDAVLIDNRTSIAANQGIKLYNRGKVKAKGQKYDIGNNSTVYNEGSFTVAGALTYSPGAGNTSYFINKSDDAALTATSMILNSTCHFFNDGKVNISGPTQVTQSGIFWINNGYYKTQTMKLGAWNGTFYNYCQLIVTDDAVFKDGEFNLMRDSYTKVGYGIFNNFRVNMGDNSTFSVVNGSAYGQQGAGIDQGFYADTHSRAYVLLGGETKIPAHKGSAFHAEGPKLTLAYNHVTFYEGCSIGDSWSGCSFWNETNEETLKKNKSENSIWDLKNVNKVAYSDAALTEPSEGECSATYVKAGKKKQETPIVFTYAFEDTYMGDYDMNDVVIQVWQDPDNENKLKVKLCCTGASKSLYVYHDDEPLFGGYEVHDLLQAPRGTFVNTGKQDKIKFYDGTSLQVITDLNKPDGFDNDPSSAKFNIRWGGKSKDESIYLTTQSDSPIGNAPYAVMIPKAWAWPMEWTKVSEAYTGFTDFATGQESETKWYDTPVEGKTYSKE